MSKSRPFFLGIHTRYHGPTNCKGSRISATMYRCSTDHPTVRVFCSYEYDGDSVTGHFNAAKKCAQKATLLQSSLRSEVTGYSWELRLTGAHVETADDRGWIWLCRWYRKSPKGK